MLLGATATLLWGLPSTSKRALSVITAGVGLYVLADVVWGYIVLHGTYRGGDRVDTLWYAAAALFAVGAARDYISSIEELIEDARNGRMFILVDAEDRENEGDIRDSGANVPPAGRELHSEPAAD